jgi:hypothetical protein
MSVALQRYPIFDVASPLKDLVFYEVVDYNIKLNRDTTYGTPHHDAAKYPHHVLVYITPADKEGKFYRFYYAAKRENQDLYNWEFTKADIGGTKFDAVNRTYIVLREEFSETTPAMGSLMPDIPEDKFNGAYILSARMQKRIETELDSIFVIESRTYVKRCTLTEIVGSKLSVEDRLYYAGELIGGVSVETLFSQPSNSFWSVQSDGSSRVGKQLSCDWYSITTQRDLEIYFIWPTPNHEDYLFYVVRTADVPPSQSWVYGTTFGGSHPNHKLVYVSPVDERGKCKFYYAANRINEDEYNWQINAGRELTRTYVKLRSSYTVSTGVGTVDSAFPQYVFAEESVLFQDEILNGLFIAVQKKYLQKETIEFKWNKDFESYIEIKKEVIPATSTTPPVVIAGKVEEIQNVNSFYSIKMTQELVNVFPYEKTSVPDSITINFPNRLRDIELLRAWAWADSSGAALQYDEDSNYKYTIDVPRAGPYSAVVRRIITADPEAVMTANPLTKIPVAQIDMVTEVWAWYWASSEGNMAKANANSIQLPATIHEEITVERNIPNILSAITPDVERIGVVTIPETPGYSEFIGLTTAVLQHDVREMDMKLYEVSIVEVDVTDLYPVIPPPTP